MIKQVSKIQIERKSKQKSMKKEQLCISYVFQRKSHPYAIIYPVCFLLSILHDKFLLYVMRCM